MLPNTPLIPIMYLSQVLNGLVLPVILFFMVRLINDRSLMGENVNGTFANILTWSTVIIISVLSIMMVVTAIW
jgi:Mn2+/Fe2+ NRAMP family transporter